MDNTQNTNQITSYLEILERVGLIDKELKAVSEILSLSSKIQDDIVELMISIRYIIKKRHNEGYKLQDNIYYSKD